MKEVTLYYEEYYTVIGISYTEKLIKMVSDTSGDEKTLMFSDVVNISEELELNSTIKETCFVVEDKSSIIFETTYGMI